MAAPELEGMEEKAAYDQVVAIDEGAQEHLKYFWGLDAKGMTRVSPSLSFC